MSTAIRGCFGKVKVKDLAATGAIAVVGGVQEWTLNEGAEEIDSSEIGTCTKAAIAGANSRTMSLTGFKAADGNQGDLTIGNIIAIELYPAGSGSGSSYYATTTGGGTVLSREESGGNDSLVTLNLSIKINGDLTTTSVP